MPSPTRSDSMMHDLLTEANLSNLVAFDHVAAGHDGICSNSAGSLVIKPCTQGEVDFYESSAKHPSFSAYMPTYMGTLRLEQDQQQPLSPAQNGTITKVTTSSLSPSSAHTSPSIGPTELQSPLSPDISVNITLDPSTQGPLEQTWTPSGGRRLDTGLSIVLENVAAGFQRPNIMDVKLGSRLWADDAPPAKRAKLDAVAQETTSASCGFRIAGMKVWQGKKVAVENGDEDKVGQLDKDGYRCYDKWYGRKFMKENVHKGFEEFLALGAYDSYEKNNEEAKYRTKKGDRGRFLAKRLAREVRCIKLVLEQEESRMYSASILIVYEGDPEALEIAIEDDRRREDERREQELSKRHVSNGTVVGNGHNDAENVHLTQDEDSDEAEEDDFDDDDDDEDEEEELDIPKVHDVRLIDFAHAGWTPGEGPDQNALQGVRSVLKILDDIATGS